MSIVVAGFDIHRAQITFDALDTESGEIRRGRIAATPAAVVEWVGRFPDREVEVALEACTGWYFVARALESAGATRHLAEVAETRARRGRKRRAKTDRTDARWLRQLLTEGRLPEAWIRPDHICELRTRTRLRKTLTDERTAWLQRIQATLFHLGLSRMPAGLAGERAREWLAGIELPAAARERIEACLEMIEATERLLDPLDGELRAYSRRQSGCRALARHFGIGGATAPTILAELGDVTRLRRSRQAVRLAGLDIGVSRSDRRSRIGKITKQGSPHLRWALRGGAVGLQGHEPRPRRVPGASRAQALPHPRLADDRPQARSTLLPRPARARGRGARACLSRSRSSARCPNVRDELPFRLAPAELPPPLGGGPLQTERPESLVASRPINHHVADLTVVDPDKPGRSRSDRNREPDPKSTPLPHRDARGTRFR